MPEFGTSLIDFIFSQSDELSWELVENEAKTAVKTYVPNANLTDISVFKDTENDNAIYLNLKYKVRYSNNDTEYRMVVKL
jgi:alpha-N-acetylglucosamine transferase